MTAKRARYRRTLKVRVRQQLTAQALCCINRFSLFITDYLGALPCDCGRGDACACIDTKTLATTP